MNPLIDFSELTITELQSKHQEYTKKLFNISPGSSLYNSVMSLRDSVSQEYQERMLMAEFKETNTQEVIEIGGIKSEVLQPDNQDYQQKILSSLAQFYSKKD